MGFLAFVRKMIDSVFDFANILIFIVALLALACFFIVKNENSKVDLNFEEWKNENYYSRDVYRKLKFGYTAFLTCITLFPLLGMLGTVMSLVMLDFSDAQGLISARSNFFVALTSTAWGIIFAIIFKVLNVFIATSADDNIRKMTELIDRKALNVDSRRVKVVDVKPGRRKWRR